MGEGSARVTLTAWPEKLEPPPEGRWTYYPRDLETGEELEPLDGQFRDVVRYGVVFMDDGGMPWFSHEFGEGERFEPCDRPEPAEEEDGDA